MTEKCESKWLHTEDQINKINIPSMQGAAQQYAKYASKLQFSPAFIALMLRDIADIFEENAITSEEGCYCFCAPLISQLIKNQLVNYPVLLF